MESNEGRVERRRELEVSDVKGGHDFEAKGGRGVSKVKH